LALAHAGDLAQAGNLTNDLARHHPDDSAMNNRSLPEIRAAMEIMGSRPAAALGELAPAAAYELSWVEPRLMPACLRGQAYLRVHRGREAAAEFQKILDHRGVVFDAPIAALAHLDLGRAYALEATGSQGDQTAPLRAKARTAYQDFLTLWKNADPDLPILTEAKAEYAKLK
jgi:hypothetical protein